MAALDAATRHGFLTDDEASVLADGWRMATRVRNAIVLSRGKPSDQVPSDPRSLAAVSRAMGYPAGAAQDLLEDYLRLTRRARAVFDDVFFR
jgi:glutamate-ammonia-ligase adenylyltransferase